MNSAVTWGGLSASPITMRFFGLLCLIGLASAGIATSQGRPPRQRGGVKQSGNPTDKTALMVMPNFTGVLKVVDKKFVTLESEDGNEKKVNITKKTKFFQGEAPITLSALKEGDKVSAEVTLAPDRTFDAVNIRREAAK